MQLLLACALASVSLAQRFRPVPNTFSLGFDLQEESTTPVPILRYVVVYYIARFANKELL